MGKLRPKLQLSFLNSIQICRPKDISSLVQNPLPHFSTINSHTHEILFPSFQESPPHPSHTTPLPPKSSIMHTTNFPSNPKSRKQEKQHLYDPPFSSDSKKSMTDEPKLKSKLAADPSEEESEKPERQRGVRTRRFKRFGSKEWKDGSISEVENEKACMVDRRKKVNDESFVVVKRSLDPCQDFKKSMLEMIVEKHMFEPKELENLLMSFLSINSRTHHRAILKAFTEIWKEVFSGSPH